MLSRTFRAGLFAAGLMLSLSQFLGGVSAQDKTAEKPSAGKQGAKRAGWGVQCGDAGQGLSCKAFQTVSMRKSGQRLLMVSVSANKKDQKSASLLLHLPHGLFLPAGVSIKVDEGKPRVLAVQTCDAKGCYAGAALKAGEVAAMKSGKILGVGFQNLKKKTLNIGMPLNGFSEAYAKLE
ncbi:MAG: invasion associated locus B family protein [Alphaproteobacteria bacterium]|nr:invasion associated locus B family protein [Alphaproteobacteria bacterium]